MRPAALTSLFLRQFALALVALALLVQAAIPSGYMAAPSDGPFPFTVVLCGGGAAGAMNPAPADQDQDQDQDGKQAPCVFAGFGAGVVTPDMPAVISVPTAYAAAGFTPAPQRAALSIGANAPPPARGPPSFI